MSQDYRHIPTGTPLSEKLDYAINNAMHFLGKIGNDFNDSVYIPPDTMALGASILAGVALYYVSKRNYLVERFVPGGRSNGLHRLVTFGLNLALATGGASVANDAVLNSYGIRTPQSESSYTIKADADLRRHAEVPQTLYAPREKQPVNPDKEARVIQINPRVQP